jgi:hypothetical protein
VGQGGNLERIKVAVNWNKQHELQCALLLEKAFKEHPRTEIVEIKDADLVVNTLPDAGFVNGKKKSVWWDLETAEYQCSQYFDQSDWIFYPNHKNVDFYDKWKDKSSFLPLATDKELFHYWEVPMEYDIVFVGREDVNRGVRVEGLDALEAHCKKKGYSFLRTNSIGRGAETSKVISSGKLTIQIAGLRNLEQRVFENSPIRPQLVDLQEENETEMSMIDPGLQSCIYFYYAPGNWKALLNKVDYYLAHMDKAERIVKHARKKFFANNTYLNRVDTILDTLNI